MKKEVLDTRTIKDYGSFKRIRQWVRGKQTGGRIIEGYTGWETVVDRDVVYPAKILRVTKGRTDNRDK